IKQPPNAYLLFNRSTRPKIKSEHPDISVSEVSKRVGEAWKFLPEEEKNKFYEEAKRLRKDFDNIQKLAKAQRESFRGKKINPANDPSQPKHPSSGFLFFLREVRPQYTAKYPKNSLGPISKMISAAWKELSAEDKAKYIQKSEEDKKRYAIEMEMWL
ncbi:hypothetical protein PIROE2DRAFT_27851, partial [Piromyces sp. E2]